MSKYKNNLPSISMPRSRFDLSHSYKTMFNQGDLIPILVQEVYPGDSFNCDTSIVIRTSTPFQRPIMDNLNLDVYFMFVPNRLVYDKWPEVMGENKNSDWVPASNPKVPMISITPNDYIQTGSLADYFGLPVGAPGVGIKVSSLPFRAYALITNDWFRNENITDPVYINTGDNPIVGGSEVLPTFNNNAWSASNFLGKPFKVNKYKDYFTSCLPAPQKGDAIKIAFANDSTNILPVKTWSNWPPSFLNLGNDLRWVDHEGDIIDQFNYQGVLGIGTDYDGTVDKSATWAMDLNFSYNAVQNETRVIPANLGVDLRSLSIANVNDLRYAFALQRMLEKDARGGTRYIEMLYSHFGVISPDARLQRSEFLGGKRIPLNVSQVAQTSGSSGSNYMAQVSALSLTNGIAGFKKGFVEHGFIIGVACVRQRHTYQQMLEKFWTRSSRYDFYDPSFAFIGEQPIKYSEIFGTTISDGVFGYQEAYADLRFKPSKITGALKTTANQGFDIWHLGDSFVSTPVLNDAFIKENSDALDRALSVPSSTAPNFVMDCFHKLTAVRVLPTYGVPGLVDHS